MARRMPGLLKGGCRWLSGRIMSDRPVRLLTSIFTCPVAPQQRQQVVRRVLPPVLLARCSAAQAGRRIRRGGPFDPVEMRPPSGPEFHAGVPRWPRQVFCEFGIDVAEPCTRSSATKRNGPLPTISVIGAEGVGIGQPLRHHQAASASRPCRAHPAAAGKASSAGRRWCGRPGPQSSSVAASSPRRARPALAQRRMQATQSLARTGSPSCNFSSGRSVRVQRLPSSRPMPLDHLRRGARTNHPGHRACRRSCGHGRGSHRPWSNRIEEGEIDLRNEFQHAAGLGPDQPGMGKARRRSGQDGAAVHADILLVGHDRDAPEVACEPAAPWRKG